MKDFCKEDSESPPKEWYVMAFGALYPIIYAHRTVEAAVPEVHFAAESVALSNADHVLDLCCGTGRHLVTLQEFGAALTGVDYSADLLALAKKQTAVNTTLVRADMRRLPFNTRFDVVFSFFTSFGYFFEDADNGRAAREMGRVLRKGGRFFMDYLNPLVLDKTLQPDSVRKVNEFTIHEHRWIDHEARRINKRVEVYRSEHAMGETFESVRLYDEGEMSALLADAGLRVETCRGDYSGAPYGPESPRMILSGTKVSS